MTADHPNISPVQTASAIPRNLREALRGMEVLVVDNDDSFTGSLVQLLAAAGAGVDWRRWDDVADTHIERADALLLSPGPGRPAERPINATLARSGRPVFGVCLGLQAIAEAFGGRVVRARRIVHGRTSRIHHAGVGCFTGLPSPFHATRYHSLAADRGSLPDCLQVTAWTADGEIMGLRHRELPVEGVQFHPESVRSQHGAALVVNAVRSATRARWAADGSATRH